MCMSPDEMSDERLAESAAFWRNVAQEEEAASGPGGHARRWNAKADRFEAVLAEREQQRVADVEEIFAAVTIEEPAPQLVAV